ncbi:hypothetical protein [Photobacterium sp. J15]|uniref:hypothetical protein n=1 Tax=Photobacterium sp. J15 TaxID=265901 RepID=UPI0007E3386F|nr:hypothetical protein [Photobacterium sp. J15]
MSQQSPRTLIINILLVLVLGLGAYQLTGIITQPGKTDTTLEKYCPLTTQGCHQDKIAVQLGQDIVHPMVETEINVNWPELPDNTNNLLLRLEGHEMMMGEYHLQLSGGDGKFSGKLLLPFCTSKTMTWKGSIVPVTNIKGIKPVYISVRMTK